MPEVDKGSGVEKVGGNDSVFTPLTGEVAVEASPRKDQPGALDMMVYHARSAHTREEDGKECKRYLKIAISDFSLEKMQKQCWI